MILLTLLFAGFSIRAADYYWVGDNGNWTDINHWATSSGGTIKHIQTPTPTDNVVFDQNSFSGTSHTVLINIGVIYCKDLDFSNLNTSLIIKGSVSLMKIHGSLKLSPLLLFQYIKPIHFESTTNTNLIDLAGINLSNEIHFNGTGRWTLSDDFHVGNVYLNSGTFRSNGKLVHATNWSSNSTTNRRVEMSSSVFEIRTWEVYGANFSVDAGTSHIMLRGSDFRHKANGKHTYYNLTCSYYFTNIINFTNDFDFNDVLVEGSGSFGSTTRYNKLSLTKGKTYQFTPSTTHTFTTDLIAVGDCKKEIDIHANYSYATFIKKTGTVDCYDLILKHIHAQGGATFNAYSTNDLGDNSGWNIYTQSHRTLYWVNGSGIYQDTTHWSAVSGGVGGECIPTLLDTVIFDDNSGPTSFNVTYEKGTPLAECHDMLWLNNTIPAILKSEENSSLWISGSILLSDSMKCETDSLSLFIFVSDTIETITSNHTRIENQVIFLGHGEWKPMDSLFVQNSIYLNKGTFNLNDNYVYSHQFYSVLNQKRKLKLTSSIWEIGRSPFRIHKDSLTVVPGTSTIRMLNKKCVFDGNSKPNRFFHNLEFRYDSTDANCRLNVRDSITFNRVTFFGDGTISHHVLTDTLFLSAGMDYQMNGKMEIFQKLIANGNCNKHITIRNKIPMTPSIIINQASNPQTVNYCNIRFIHASGGFNATNSGDLGYNSGWNFSSNGTVKYWVGNTGYWHNHMNWALTSGGTPGTCIPGPYDDVVFDQNSFSSNTDIVKAVHDIACHNMTWISNSQTPTFSVNEHTNAFFTGSIELIPDMIWNYKPNTFFLGNETNKTIRSYKHSFDTVIYCDTGKWTLLDTMHIRSTCYFYSGELVVNGHELYCHDFLAWYGFKKTLDIQNSRVFVGTNRFSYWNWFQNGLAELKSNNSSIYLSAYSFKFFFRFGGTGHTYLDHVYFTDLGGTGTVQHYNTQPILHFKYLECKASTGFYGKNIMDTLYFEPGHYFYFNDLDTQFITNKWIANASCYQDITLVCPSSTAYVKKINGNVLLNRVNLQGIHAVGTPTYTINEGTDMGNNSNWMINPIIAADHYWVNGTGEWNDTAHWSYSSNGVSGACIPNPKDDVFFDSLSFQKMDTVMLDNPQAVCHDMDWTGAQYKPKFRGTNMSIYGGLKLIDSLNYAVTKMTFLSHHPGNSITTANHDLWDTVIFSSAGDWQLEDSLYLPDGVIKFEEGGLKTQSHDIFCKIMLANTTKHRFWNLGSSTLEIQEECIVNSENFSLLSGNSLLFFPDSFSTIQRLYTYGTQPLEFHNVFFESFQQGQSKIQNASTLINRFNHVKIYNNGIINGSNIFDSLTFAAGNTYELQHNLTQEINDHWYVRGNNCWAITLKSTQKDVEAFVTKKTGNVLGDFINMRDIHAQGGSQFFAGDYSTDISNNQGWMFSNGPQYVFGLGLKANFPLGGSTVLNTTNFNGGPLTSYAWSTGSTADSIVVNQVGWYYVSVTFAGGCVIEDSIYVGCSLNISHKITDVRCHGDSTGAIQIIIPDSSYHYDYLWSTGGIGSSLSNIPSNDYIIQVVADSGRCIDIDTLRVNQPPPIIIPQSDTAFCLHDSVMLNLGGQYIQWSWLDGYSKQYRMVSSPTTFYVKVQDTSLCWSKIDTINVIEVTPPHEFLGSDTTLCMNDFFILKTDSVYDQYLWSTGSIGPALYVNAVGTYWLNAKYGPCLITDTITFYPCQPLLELPNIFTPNNDGANDRFIPENKNIEYFEMYIYNRWGMLIYKTENLEYGWDGKIKGQNASEGVYFYTITYKNYNGENAGLKQFKNGTVSLYRN